MTTFAIACGAWLVGSFVAGCAIGRFLRFCSRCDGPEQILNDANHAR